MGLPPYAIGGPVEYEEPSMPWNGMMFIGETPGEEEVAVGRPLAGRAGECFARVLETCGIDRRACWVADTIRYRPEAKTSPGGKVQLNHHLHFFVGKRSNERNERLPPYQNKYLMEVYAEEVRELWRTVKRVKPKVIVTMGNLPLWAMCWQTGITRLHGEWQETPAGPYPVMPTFHPSFVASGGASEGDMALDIIAALERLSLQGAA